MSYFEDASLVYIPSAVKNAKTYSIKPTDGSGDLTFSRASNATRVNSSGLVEKVRTNLVTYSEDWTNAAWTKTNATVTANATTNPIDGATTADAIFETIIIGQHNFFNGFSATIGNEITISFYAKANGRTKLRMNNGSSGITAAFDLTAVTASMLAGTGTPTITSVGSGWYRCSIRYNAVGSTEYVAMNFRDDLDQDVYVGDITKGMYFFGAQAETGVLTDYIATTSAAVSVGPVSGLPRLDYSGGCPSLLLEPQRTNVARYSEQFDNAAWVKSGSGVGIAPVVTANDGISPDGYQNADKIDLNLNSGTSSSDWSWVYQSFSVTGTQPQAFSIYLKAATAGDVGKVISLGFIEYVNHTLTADWTRVVVNQTYATTSTFYIGFRLRGTEATASTASLYAWGAQLEQNASYSTSYIPTLSSAVTRVADAASKTGISSLIGQTAGTLFVEYNSNITEDDSFFLVIDDGTANNRIVLYSNVPNNLALVISAGGVLQTIIPNIPLASGTNKFAVAYANNDIALYLNGVSKGTDNAATIPATSALRMGTDNTGAALASGKGINQALVFKTRLSNADLATLTTI